MPSRPSRRALARGESHRRSAEPDDVGLGPVNTIGRFVISLLDGAHRDAVRTHRALPPATAWQCQHAQFAGAQRDPVRRRAGVQVARVAEALWETGTRIYTRMNRWSKNGVLDRVFEHLQRAQLIRIKLEAVSLDSTVVKVHPDGTGARKRRPPSHRQVPRRVDHQDSSGCRGCSNGTDLRALARPGPRQPGRQRGASGCRPGRPGALSHAGSRTAEVLNQTTLA